jgi:DNA-binding response OmpR family regulator
MKTRTAFDTVLISSLSSEVLADAASSLGPGSGRSRRVLIVDDDRRVADMVAQTLVLDGYQAKTAYTGEDGLALALEFRPHIVISDVGLPEMDGITLGEHISALSPKTRIILMCECVPQNSHLISWATLKKPFHASELLAVLGPAEAHHG